jgi:hypothetical protein
MLSTLTHRLSRRPRRTLLAVLAFVILAGAIGDRRARISSPPGPSPVAEMPKRAG